MKFKHSKFVVPLLMVSLFLHGFRAEEKMRSFKELHLITAGVNKRSKGDNEGAIEFYTQAIQIYPERPVGYLLRGRAFKDMGFYRLAIRDESTALERTQTMYNNHQSDHW